MQWHDITSEFQFHAWRSTRLKNQSAHVMQRKISTQLFALDVTSGEPHQGGYAGVRLGEAQNPQPAEHERDNAEEEPCPHRTRINEAGDAVPGSQHSTTRGTQNLQFAGKTTTALIPWSSGRGTHPTDVEQAPAARAAWGGGTYKDARNAVREQGLSKTGIASLPHVKLAPMRTLR